MFFKRALLQTSSIMNVAFAIPSFYFTFKSKIWLLVAQQPTMRCSFETLGLQIYLTIDYDD